MGLDNLIETGMNDGDGVEHEPSEEAAWDHQEPPMSPGAVGGCRLNTSG